MHRWIAIAVALGLTGSTGVAAPVKTPRTPALKAAVSSLPKPVLRYPSAARGTRWLGWNVGHRAGKPLPVGLLLQQNVFWGYRDVYKRDPSEKGGWRYVGRRGGALYRIDRGLDRAAKMVQSSRVWPRLYDVLGL